MLNPLLLLLPLLAAPAQPCTAIPRAGLRVSGDTRICPGVYRIPDPREGGVLVVSTSDTRIDLTGVTLESGDSVPAAFVGVGILARDVDRVTIVGGRIRGYRWGIRIIGGRGHQVRQVTLSGSRRQALRSTAVVYDEGDWLDIFAPDSTVAYGGGLLLEDATAPLVTGVTARGAQNGIALIRVRQAYVADNDVSGNSGWGISLYSSAANAIVRNDASRNVRCEAPSWSRGCDSAALLLRDRSDSNLVADNDLRWSGDGFFLSGERGRVRPSDGNIVVRNDATGSPHNAFEATFSAGNVFADNRADSSGYGFWLGYSAATLVRGNSILGSRVAGIAIEHGADNELARNTIVGAPVGVHLFAPHPGDVPSRGTTVAGNTIGGTARGVLLERTAGAVVIGNVFDAVTDALVADGDAADARVTGNVFLGAAGWWIDAPDLNAGGNYWAASDLRGVLARVKGRVVVAPWEPASAAGY
ncbi:MAG TPA: NosD domain-containing protein [Gemmatimonadales bacterium]|nr:NosD domain-containing protein [Gemmatimonadales bacterium]